MPDTLPRYCSTCIHFRPDREGCFGQCAHEARQPATDVIPVVRWKELPCRFDFSNDLWVARVEEDLEAALATIGLRVWGPFPDDAPLDNLPADLIATLAGLNRD